MATKEQQALEVMHRVCEDTLQNGQNRDTLRRAYQCVRDALADSPAPAAVEHG